MMVVTHDSYVRHVIFLIFRALTGVCSECVGLFPWIGTDEANRGG